MNKHSKVYLAVILAASLGIVACDDDDDNPNSPGQTASPSPAASPSAAPSPNASPSASPSPTGGNTGSGNDFEVGQEVALFGTVKRVEGDQIKVGGMWVSAASGASLVRNGTGVRLGDFQVGDVVRVKGTVLPDGSIEATSIRTDD